MLPIYLNPNKRTIVVVGGGGVGKRKAEICAEAGFAVRMVDPVAEPWIGVEWLAEPYRAEHLTGVALAIAAATTDVNAAVVADARRAGVLVCDAADPAAGDFIFPAVMRRGLLTVAVSTGGASPALSAAIRDELEARFGPEYASWLELLAEARQSVLERIPDAGVRRNLLTNFASGAWLDQLRAAGPEAVRAGLLAVVEAAVRQTHSEPES